tara:strand:- start:9380 stop:10141 length:762 start_codon:yes stop_codon:yes gene_type:complete
MFTPFYNESLRKLVIAFGSLFNDIRVTREDSKVIRVPLAYGAKEKFIRRIEEASSITDNTDVAITLPRLGFDITAMSYDPQRKGNKLRKRIMRDSDTGLSYSYAEVPYNVSFGLYAFSRSMDDNLQMIEQVLPYFTPEFNVTVNMNTLNQKVDVPIVMNSVQTTEDYEGDFSNRRTIITSFDLTAKSYIYNRIKTGKVILESTIDIFGSYEKFYADTDSAQDLRITATGAYVGATGTQGYTSGNRIYGPISYE